MTGVTNLRHSLCRRNSTRKMYPAIKRNIPPANNQYRGLDKADVEDDGGTGKAVSSFTAVKVARGLSGGGVKVGIRDKTAPGVGEGVLATVALG